MGEQNGTQSSAKQRKSRKINTVNQDNGKQTPIAQRPINDEEPVQLLDMVDKSRRHPRTSLRLFFVSGQSG
jgi:hypothetical protein